MRAVLFVDDEEGFLDVMGRRLRRRGFAPTLARSGEEALRALREAPFDVVITDLKMPGMDGLELVDRLKREAPHVPVILITGHGGEEEAREALRRGACDYLHKPCELEDLLACLARVLGGMICFYMT